MSPRRYGAERPHAPQGPPPSRYRVEVGTDTTPSTASPSAPTARPQRQARALATRETIVDAAAVEFARHGYHAASLSRVIERSGVTKGALYFHFSSKQELGLAVMAEMGQAYREAAARCAGLGLDPLREAAHLAREVQDLLTDRVAARAGQRLSTEGFGGPEWEGFGPRFWEGVFAGLFRRASAEGLTRPGVDPRAMARMVVDFSGGSFRASLAVSGLADLAERVRFNFEVALAHAARDEWLAEWRASGGMAAVLGEHLTAPRAGSGADLL